MPCAPVEGNVLGDSAGAIDEQVGRNAHVTKLCQPGVQLIGQGVGEEAVDEIAAETTRRQGYPVDHDQRDVLGIGTLVAVGRGPERNPDEAMVFPDAQNL